MAHVGPVVDERVMASYAGQVYIDVPYVAGGEAYRVVQAFLEFPDGTLRFSAIRFWVVSLELAMKNTHHDEPRFWERWSDNF